MTVMKKTEQKDDAVSPVVGVMLMLVVTIIIAAVVAAFASGVTADVEPVPTTILKADIDADMEFWEWVDKVPVSSLGKGTVFLTSMNGDTINLNKVSIIISNSTGHSVTYNSPIYGYTSGEYLESGETMNLAYSADSSGNGKGLSYLGVTLNEGDYAHILVTYDDTHILYDGEVRA